MGDGAHGVMDVRVIEMEVGGGHGPDGGDRGHGVMGVGRS